MNDDHNDISQSRRKILTKVGLGAAAFYMAPAVTTLSMAHASS